ncbi:MAG TPA: hypothetical protein VGN63_16990 [Flavisolibacter sp.]|jgi:YD repeat-containing protein|nr:hypothetical protein [Flavisolibacter sp.]
MNGSKIILLISLCILLFSATAQQNPYNEVSIASPTAASLAKYADIPVSYHTGLPNIGIPIYTVKSGSLQLPISLSYHAGGIKVLEPASWVGTGWALNAGGVITRAVRGAPDERGTSSVDGQTHGYFSDYGYANYISYIGVQGGLATAFTEGKKDGEPDLFNFNFGGYSGKFYFRDDRTPIFEPQQNIKVEYVYSGSGSIQSFVLTPPDGVRYHFGVTSNTADVDPVERTNPATVESGYVEGTAISSWYLNKIESSDRTDFINLNYQLERYSYYTLSNPTLRDNNNNTTIGGSTYDYSLIKNIVKGVRLSSIVFPNGKVDFLTGSLRQDLANASTAFTPEVINDSARTLGVIQITDNNSFCKKFVFSYDYFSDTRSLSGYFANYGLQTDAKRLKLLSVQEKSCDGLIVIPVHSFDYFTETLPRRLSFEQDHWGFANGASTNNQLLPTYTENEFTVFPGANRDPAWPAMRGGALKRITYPTGGFTDFEFEHHTAWAESRKFNEVLGPGISVGWSNTNPTVEQTNTLNSNNYRITLSSANQGGLATINVYNSSNTLVFTLSANPGESKQGYLYVAAGSYKLVLIKSNMTTSGFGASSSFYEMIPYTYSRNEMVGGLRIKSMIHNNGGSSSNVVTNYSYTGSNNRTTGVLYSRQVYVQVIRNDEVKQAGMGGPNGNGSPSGVLASQGCIAFDNSTSLPYAKTSGSVRPLSTSQGNHIGYNEVKVLQQGNGHTIYRYYGSDRWDAVMDDIAIRNVNAKPPCNGNIPNSMPAPIPFEPKRGELKYEGYFNEAGQLLKEVDHYHYYSEEKLTTPGLIQAVLGGTYRASTYYEIKAVRKTEQTTVEKTIIPSVGQLTVTSKTLFESPYHYQPTRQVTFDSKGDSLEKKFRYAADFRVASCDAISDCHQIYTDSVNTITAWFNQQRSTCSTDGCIWNSYQQYRERLAAVRRTFVSCRRSNFSDPNSIYKSNFASAKSAADTELKPILELQEQNNFSTVETSEWKGGKLARSLFNRFDYTTNPASYVYLNKTQAINVSALSTTFTQAATNNTTIVKDSRYQDEAQVKFDGGKLVQLVKKDGISNSYYWGYSKTYPIAHAINAKGGEIYHSSFEESGTWGNGLEWQHGASTLTAYDNSRSRAGRLSGKIEKPTAGERVVHADQWLSISNSTQTEYTYSGWVYSTGPSIEIYLFMKTASETFYYTNIDYVHTNVTNQWVYVEKTFPVPANITKLNIRIDNNGGGTVWFDDIRLHPKKAMMTTYTYDPLVGMTSQTDPNNRTTYYDYDGFGRLFLVRDHDKNILKKYCYNYQGQQEDCSAGCTTITANWVNVGSPYCQTSNGVNTGYQLQNQLDNNPCSPTYNTTRTVSSSNTTTCPVPTTIYAQISYENYYSTWYQEYADVVVRFYSDVYCTQPVSVSNLQVNYQQVGAYGYSNFNYANSTYVYGTYIVLEYGAMLTDNSTYPASYQNFYLNPGNYTIAW